ncbi:alpha-1,2-fucosyltransferase [Pigmentibacter ruber]
MKITVRLRGGLGNQMFQFAAGAALAKKLNAQLFLDKSDSSLKLHHYSLEKFNLDCKYVKKNAFFNKFMEFLLIINYKIKRYFNIDLVKNMFYFEKSPAYESHFFDVKKSKYLIGYFQSEKYFLNYKEFILKQFQFPDNLNNKNKILLERIHGTNSVSVHIRRGDYITNPSASQVHGNCCDNEYYNNSIKYLQNLYKDIELFIFSDEIEWVKKNMPFNCVCHYIENNKEENPIEDLRLMSNCKNNIIANSTFSWWGAYLNSNENKIIIAPKNWFSNADLNSKIDIIPSSWVRI